MNQFVVMSALLAVMELQAAIAQVMTPMELSDPQLQRLQQRHLQALMVIGREIEQHKFPYPLYLCRKLDIDVDKVEAADQRSIRFESYQQKTVLAITGDYYASYSAQRMDDDARVKETFRQVIVPILQAEVPHFPDDSEFAAFAVEVSHHVRRRIMGMSSEIAENVALIIPVDAAQKLVDAKTDEAKQAAILDAAFFLNGEPRALWLGEGAPPEEWKDHNRRPVSSPAVAAVSAQVAPTVSSTLLKATPVRIITPESLAGLQRRNQSSIDRLVEGLDPQAHFVPYAPPSFIGFRQATYLELSTNAVLTAAGAASRYRLAALAFDEHVSHLIRPLLDYFPSDVQFDGVDFSTTIHTPGNEKSEAVEFFLPYRMMRCFASYDCTGQQLLDSGTVVIDGERAGLDLQIAEGKD